MIENDNYVIKYNGILFKVSVCNPPKSKPQYEKMLVVKLVDPSTGHIMQDLYKIDKRMNELKELIKTNIEPISKVESAKAELDRLKSGNSNYFISGNVYVMHDEADMETLRKKAYEKARQLYCANSKELCKKITDEAPRIGEYNANNLYQLYFSRFKKSNYMKRCSPSTAKLKDRIVREACEKLSAKRVCDLKEKDISELFSEKKFQSKKHLIEDFFEFCRELDAYNCPNPIKNYFSSNPGIKSKKPKNSIPLRLNSFLWKSSVTFTSSFAIASTIRK